MRWKTGKIGMPTFRPTSSTSEPRANSMTNAYIHSVVLELQATNTAALSATMGHQAHALFLNLIKQVDPALAERLHDEPNYRPFTVSPLSGVPVQGDCIA